MGKGNCRAVFLDRDGVINEKAPKGEYIKNWDEFEFLRGVKEAIRKLNEKGFLVIVVSNQRGDS
jgi:HAD superfamily hydrolase (TIGR01662 family)